MNKKKIIIIFLIFVFNVTTITLIFNDSVWSDEAFTMIILKKNFIDIVKTTALDCHPPLYYLIAKAFTIIFGYNVPIVKIVSILPVIISMIFVFIKSKQLFKENYYLITIIYVLLIGFSPISFQINIELRMYTWAMLFITCSGIYAYELYNNVNNRVLLKFVFSSLLAAYTHYYAAVTLLFIYLITIFLLLLKDKNYWKYCIKIIILTLLIYLPWIPVFIKQFFTIKQNWWLNNLPSAYKFINYLFYGKFVHLFIIFIYLFIIINLVINIKNNKEKENIFSLLCILSLLITNLFGFVVSTLIRPLFIPRYMYPSAGLFFLGISIVIAKSNYKKFLLAILIVIITLNFPFSYCSQYTKEYKTGTESFKSFANKNIKKNEISVDNDVLLYFTLKYYMSNNKINYNIQENTKGYVFSKNSINYIKSIIQNSKINLVYCGNIDSTSYFNIYYIE